MQKVTKVVIGAASFLQNGYMVARIGTSMICCLAKHYKVPVIAFCETYKFSDKTLLDALTQNES